MTDCYSTSGSLAKIASMVEAMVKERGFDPYHAHGVTILATPLPPMVTRQTIMVAIELRDVPKPAGLGHD